MSHKNLFVFIVLVLAGPATVGGSGRCVSGC